jgi:hypothetical protein
VKPGVLSLVGIAALALSALGIPAQAQQLDSLQRAWILSYPNDDALATTNIRMTPGSSAGSGTAFGADWGIVYAGFTFQERTRNGVSPDGSATAGVGFGNAQKWVGVDVAVNSMGTVNSFGRFSFSVKAHRRLPGRAAVAVGIDHAAIIGYSDTHRSVYGVATKQFAFRDSPRDLFSAVTASLGAGNGRYVSEKDWYAQNYDRVNVFGSVGLRVAEPVSVIADWTGQDLVLGASLIPFKRIPLVINPGVADVVGTAGDGPRFVLAVGVGSYVPNLFSRR